MHPRCYNFRKLTNFQRFSVGGKSWKSFNYSKTLLQKRIKHVTVMAACKDETERTHTNTNCNCSTYTVYLAPLDFSRALFAVLKAVAKSVALTFSIVVGQAWETLKTVPLVSFVSCYFACLNDLLQKMCS